MREIHNTYFGKGIGFSNSFGLDTVEKLKTSCLAKAGAALTAVACASIEMDAQDIFTIIYSNENENEPRVRDAIESLTHDKKSVCDYYRR